MVADVHAHAGAGRRARHLQLEPEHAQDRGHAAGGQDPAVTPIREQRTVQHAGQRRGADEQRGPQHAVDLGPDSPGDGGAVHRRRWSAAPTRAAMDTRPRLRSQRSSRTAPLVDGGSSTTCCWRRHSGHCRSHDFAVDGPVPGRCRRDRHRRQSGDRPRRRRGLGRRRRARRHRLPARRRAGQGRGRDDSRQGRQRGAPADRRDAGAQCPRALQQDALRLRAHRRRRQRGRHHQGWLRGHDEPREVPGRPRREPGRHLPVQPRGGEGDDPSSTRARSSTSPRPVSHGAIPARRTTPRPRVRSSRSLARWRSRWPTAVSGPTWSPPASWPPT